MTVRPLDGSGAQRRAAVWLRSGGRKSGWMEGGMEVWRWLLLLLLLPLMMMMRMVMMSVVEGEQRSAGNTLTLPGTTRVF